MIYFQESYKNTNNSNRSSFQKRCGFVIQLVTLTYCVVTMVKFSFNPHFSLYLELPIYTNNTEVGRKMRSYQYFSVFRTLPVVYFLKLLFTEITKVVTAQVGGSAA